MCDCDCGLPKRERWKLVKDEALRQAAEKIRAGKGTYYPTSNLGGDGWIADAAADLIDPDKEA